MRLLLVEDDRKLGSVLTRVLTSHGYQVVLAANATQARTADVSAIDLAVVDWMLPDGDGLQVCIDLRRADYEGPVLMLTARGQTKDRVQALDLGADDYLTKPFEMEELLARLRALLRRGPRLAALDVGPLHLDIGRRNAFANGKFLALTVREFDLLAYLARRAGQVATKIELIENVWDADEIVPNVVEVHVSRLRDKLGDHAWTIETLRGAGYRLRAERDR
ncbi:Phosphate regulon transcriptional regulatory protein PhoB (SphR) [Labilithrix luteola]|uniref:Phosphate regulon transcriptional regulatory protein PhoB (SphR) n=1 Tax=Labilithrix luteola TaxID=1391654 RepID=A0A0K1PYS4_9BACT|nr:response regulator transcription factor [Labilithrix luteola]AKU98678.1 Phosphate regulon transcriptional regulatory protein PhoB (SphR) [Labilithrix luteola]